MSTDYTDLHRWINREVRSCGKVVTIILVLCFLVINSGCRRNHEIVLEGVTDLNATAIAFNARGEMIDFVHIRPDAKIDWIEFHVPEKEQEVFALVVGPNVESIINSNTIVSSRVGEGYFGRVEVDVDRGIVQSLQGNGISWGNDLLKTKHLLQIKDLLEQESVTHPASTIIVYENVYLEDLVKDAKGNFVPKDLSEKEASFIEKVIPLIESKDLDALKFFIHTDIGDTFSIKSKMDHLEILLKQGFKTFTFMKLDRSHPDNRHHLYDHDGNEYRNSLNPEWEVRFKLKKTIDSFFTDFVLLIGDDNGVLKFPTTYAK